MIKLTGLSKAYDGNQVLNGIDLEVKKGDIVVIIGPSGTGKSTLLRCLNLLETPTSGTITFEGTEITDPKTDIDKVRQFCINADEAAAKIGL